MDYKKEYKAALERCREFYAKLGNKQLKEEVEDIFPELKESEDDKIRKWIIAYLENRVMNTSITDEKDNCLDAIKWLEKQGKIFTKKDVDDAYLKGVCDTKQEIEKQGEEKMFIPKFRIGDIVKSKSQPMLDSRMIINIDKDCYRTKDGGCIGFAWEKDYELIKQKPAEWSEEDEKRLDNAITQLKVASNIIVDDKVYDSVAFIKSLKDRVQPKQEWSEEDEDNFVRIDYACLKVYGGDSYSSDWLRKLLGIHKKWKPSDEQMEALWNVYKGGKEQAELATLYNDLKKLKG